MVTGCEPELVGEADDDLVGSLVTVVVAEELDVLDGKELLENDGVAEEDLEGLILSVAEDVVVVVLDVELDDVDVLEEMAETDMSAEAEKVFVETAEVVEKRVGAEEYVEMGESDELLLANDVKVLVAVFVELFELMAELVGRI